MRRKSTFSLVFFLSLFSTLIIFLVKFHVKPEQTVAQTSGSNIKVTSSYYGRVAGGPSEQDYAPSIILDNGVYKMWWCHYHINNSKDRIWYATSNDGFHWSEPKIVLEHGGSGGQEGPNVCDPSVIRVNNQYYMYYTSDSPTNTGRHNQIFLARSSDGIAWIKYPSNENPQAIISCQSPSSGDYCIGQSSLLYLNGQFKHYFTESTDGRNKIYLATSQDGINFNLKNNGQPVIYDQAGVDVKYSPNLGVYFAVYGGGSWNTSTDGINWLVNDPNRTIEVQKEFNHNFGLLGSDIGRIDDQTVAYYGAGTYSPLSWDIDATTITLASLTTPTPTPTPTPCPKPGIPSNITCNPTCDEGLLFEWQDNSHNENGFKIVKDYFFNVIGNVGPNTTSWHYNWCGDQNNHSYNIYPYNQCGDTMSASGVVCACPACTSTSTPTPTPSLVPEDLNRDGKVDSQDIKILLQNWGTSPSIPEADLNSDGIVNGMDFGIMVKLML